MDFALTDDQEALRDLARALLADATAPERLKQLELEGDRFDRQLWAALARANLLGLALPEDLGGSGLGLLELCVLLGEVGRAVAPVPVLPTLVLGALPLAMAGTPEQQARLLRGVASGDVVLTAALAEDGAPDPRQPATVARRDGDRYRLDGTKTCVAYAHVATRVLVTARAADDGDLLLALVDPNAAGVRLERQVTGTGEPQSFMELSGAVVEAEDVLAVGGRAREVLDWALDRALVALAAMQVGVCERALEMTATYTSQREQFGRPLASFQAVQQRIADAYIDVESMRWTMWYAAWCLTAGLPAEEAVPIAKFWASEAAQKVVSAAQHLHGGVGVDLDYPLHRYFLFSKQIELTLGSATPQLLRLGAELAAG